MVIAAALGSALGVPAAVAQVSCGEVVTQSVRLEHDLDCGASLTNGLVVGADDVTIDLNGHTITGPQVSGGGTLIGIDNRAGHDRVTVRDGGVSNYASAFAAVGASDNRVVNTAAVAAGSAIEVEGGSRNSIARSDVSGDRGISVTASHGFRIVENTVAGSFQPAIEVEGSGGLIARNTTTDSFRGGIIVRGNGHRIAENVVPGVLDVGIEVSAGSSNVVTQNWVVDTSDAIEDDRTGDGIHVGAFTAGTVLRSNIAIGNHDDGIDLESASATLIRNLANDNGDSGIYALPGTRGVDNLASGNNNPLQCSGITCG